MGFNNQSEHKKFEALWQKYRKEYLDAGMDECSIDSLYELDKQIFNSDRRYQEHTQTIPQHMFFEDGAESDESRSPILKKFTDSFSVDFWEGVQQNAFCWFDDIESDDLWTGISKLSISDRELLTLRFAYGYSITEIARMRGVTQANISRKIIRIKKFLKKFLEVL